MDFFKARTAATSTLPKADNKKTGETICSIPSKPTPWVEKYRPRSVDDVAFQEEVVAVLRRSLLTNDLPNLLFYGPPGTGKTSTILAVAHQLFGADYKSRVLELNASDERGIQVIREKVKTFAQQSSGGTRSDGSQCPSFKLIILDEADSMTASAQAALRRVMEKETRTTRFCLICNYISRIIEPLTSRCSKFRFKPLPSDVVLQRLKSICVQERVFITDLAMDELIKCSEGDLRKAVTILQSVSKLKKDEEASVEDIMEVSGIVPQKWVDEMLAACQADSFDNLYSTVKAFMEEGYSASQLISQVHNSLIHLPRVNDSTKCLSMQKLSEVEHSLSIGADEFLQIMSLFCHLSGLLSRPTLAVSH